MANGKDVGHTYTRSEEAFVILILTVIMALWVSTPLIAKAFPYEAASLLEKGFLPINHHGVPRQGEAQSLTAYCETLTKMFQKYGWEKNPCSDLNWKIRGYTLGGFPLIYWTYGEGNQTTLVLSGVHPDELTPLPMGFRLAQHIAKNPDSFDPLSYRVVIAPLVNPDGFILPEKPTRYNGQGIDPNRNFLTWDWYDKAREFWRTKRYQNPRHFPGHFPQSEQETAFQAHLIQVYQPDKIVSIHAPLGFLDYDGPGDREANPARPLDRQAKGLASGISKKSNNYQIVDYSFFPGSLGNFAGNELKIPTVTLELKSTDPSRIDQYWAQFLPGMLHSIVYPFQRYGYVQEKTSHKLFDWPDHSELSPSPTKKSEDSL